LTLAATDSNATKIPAQRRWISGRIEAALQEKRFCLDVDDDVSMPPDSLSGSLRACKRSRVPRKWALFECGRMHPFVEPTELEIAPWRGTLWRTDVMKQWIAAGRLFPYTARTSNDSLRASVAWLSVLLDSFQANASK